MKNKIEVINIKHAGIAVILLSQFCKVCKLMPKEYEETHHAAMKLEMQCDELAQNFNEKRK